MLSPLGALPLAVKPRTSHDEIGVLRIALLGVTENLPRSPGIFLIPESRNIQVGNGRGMKLADPGFFFPELIVVGMLHGGIPVRNRAVQIFRVDVRERTEIRDTTRRYRKFQNRSACSCSCRPAP